MTPVRERCVVVEDTEPGVRAAAAAGMRGLGHAPAETDAEPPGAAGARVFRRMRELPGRLASG